MITRKLSVVQVFIIALNPRSGKNTVPAHGCTWKQLIKFLVVGATVRGKLISIAALCGGVVTEVASFDKNVFLWHQFSSLLLNPSFLGPLHHNQYFLNTDLTGKYKALKGILRYISSSSK